MKVVILAGGLGTRLAEDTALKPKPMVEIGDRPILWHIMKIYAAHGLNDFIICLGYKGYLIKEYFANYDLHNCDVTFDLRTQTTITHRRKTEDWRITLVDTGADTMTGGRLRRVREHLGDTTFCRTYGDGVGNIDITALLAFHRAHGRKATVTATQPPGRFGALRITESTLVTGFDEKPVGDGGWINGGFFVLEPPVLDLIVGDSIAWEQEPMKSLAANGDLCAYRHPGFWQPMDTLRDKQHLESLWRSGNAPWRVWES